MPASGPAARTYTEAWSGGCPYGFRPDSPRSSTLPDSAQQAGTLHSMVATHRGVCPSGFQAAQRRSLRVREPDPGRWTASRWAKPGQTTVAERSRPTYPRSRIDERPTDAQRSAGVPGAAPLNQPAKKVKNLLDIMSGRGYIMSVRTNMAGGRGCSRSATPFVVFGSTTTR